MNSPGPGQKRLPPPACTPALAWRATRVLEGAEFSPIGKGAACMADYPSSFDREDLLKCARGELFGPGNAQLPEPPMLMMDRITEITMDGGQFGKGHVVAELDITPALWFFE